MNRKIFIVRLTVALVVWFASACQKQRDPGQPSPGAVRTVSADPKPITQVHLGFQKIGAPFLLKSRSAELDKHLAEASAKADWKEFKHGPALLEAVNAKEVDIGYVGETPPVFAQAAGVDFVYVANDPPAPKAEAIVVRKDSPVRTPADLKGKKVALNRGSNVHYLLLKALESSKLGVNDIEVVYLAPGDARPAFDSGQVDAWVIWDPFLAAAELSGSRVLVDGEGLVDNHFFYVARRDFAEQHPELLRIVLDEFRSLSDWESRNPEEASKILAGSSAISYEALLLAEKRHSYGVLPITGEVLETQQRIANAFRKLELIPKDITTRDAFVPAAVYAKRP
ncbi:MAG TPA: aliphatic sulfonate ABC transporter substrate-binding protein [Polyangiaceae bacterium]|nr:aliphatic sulfonate ABC transporter substrate-binding protein [Polyangiaceae bacterium]